MTFRLQPWQLAVVLVLACVLAVGVVHWWSVRTPANAAWLLQTLPEDRSVHLFVDFEALREAGFLDVLAGPAPPEDLDYTMFVQDTGFDYRTDLNAVAAAFTEGDLYLAVRGVFDWPQLTAYARAQGGQCLNSVCEMRASRPGRNISFFPLRADVLALAVSAKPRNVTVIALNKWRTPPVVPGAPVWVSAPGSKFAEVGSLPTGSHSLLSPLRDAQRATFTLGPSTPAGSVVPLESAGLELRLDADFPSPAGAGEITRQLTATTELLRSMLVRDSMKANPADLSGVLTSGRFETKGDRLQGVWDIDRRFVDTLVSGKLQ